MANRMSMIFSVRQAVQPNATRQLDAQVINHYLKLFQTNDLGLEMVTNVFLHINLGLEMKQMISCKLIWKWDGSK